MIADVAFDTPVIHSFAYRVPDGWRLTPGQRVAAPLRGAPRTGMVVAIRAGDGSGLKSLLECLDPAPVLDAQALDLARWIAAESLSTLGSTCAALLPPPPAGVPGRPVAPDAGAARDAAVSSAAPPVPELLVGAGRERRLLERVTRGTEPALLITADIEAAARWAERLSRHGAVARLDSGVDERQRERAWSRLARGLARLGVGTRSALLTPLPPGAIIALLDEQEAAHRPPGPPPIHARPVVLERARRGSLHAILTAATPSAEMWWEAREGRATLSGAEPGAWPTVAIADTRGILRREPLTPTLARAVREALGAGRRGLLLVSRRTSTLACEECGAVLRCERCALALVHAPAARSLDCRVCGGARALPETCPDCRGRRLTPFGWGLERVEQAVHRRFPRARVAVWDPASRRSARGQARRATAADADVVVGTRSALGLFGPHALGVVGVISPDQLLRLPDFRAGERAFQLLWAAAERVRPDGAVVVQSQHPEHYAFAAVREQRHEVFYGPELSFRAELGYPPFRRLAIVGVQGDAEQTASLAGAVSGALAGDDELTVYPSVGDRRGRRRRVVVKGPADLPRRLADALGEFRGPRRRGIMDIEVDPVEWPF